MLDRCFFWVPLGHATFVVYRVFYLYEFCNIYCVMWSCGSLVCLWTILILSLIRVGTRAGGGAALCAANEKVSGHKCVAHALLERPTLQKMMLPVLTQIVMGWSVTSRQVGQMCSGAMYGRPLVGISRCPRGMIFEHRPEEPDLPTVQMWAHTSSQRPVPAILRTTWCTSPASRGGTTALISGTICTAVPCGPGRWRRREPRAFGVQCGH